ncbi:MAG TPA: YfcE family phosphodiesterase [Myxococcota bacterium]|nr:YfcE family phosphodiesterase [Myxococcota bacterium]
MRIGVISDTHNHLANVARIVELLNAARVERVIHTGDITQAKTLHALAALDAPLCGVYGNNDVERASLERACAELGFEFTDPPLRLALAGRRVLVVHDPRDLRAHPANAELALHGHDHRTVRERRHGLLVFNPGECAGHLPGHNRVGVVDLLRLETELLHF